MQFPFGYGLSYTDFEIANHKLKQEENCIEVSADIKNIGPVDGDEVLQIYVASKNSEQDRPVKLLKGFKRVSVKAGEIESVSVAIDHEDLKFYNAGTGEWVLDNSYTVLAGTNSKNAKPVGVLEF